MKNPLVSVIMACYNENIEWVNKSIESILNQSYKNIEFIIICDNPKNMELIRQLDEYKNKDSRIKYFINEKNLGLVKSLNRALSLSSGKYIARMDADDISMKFRINSQVTYLEDNPKVDMVMAGIEYIDEDDNYIKHRKKSTMKTKNILKALKYTSIAVHPTWMFRREILDVLKGYHQIDSAEDYDFLCRFILNDFKFECLNEYLLKYRIRKNGITKSRRFEQEINAQEISRCYRLAIKNNMQYLPLNMINQLGVEELELLKKSDDFFKKEKLIFAKTYSVKALINLILFLLKYPYKRRQIYNYVAIKLICI